VPPHAALGISEDIFSFTILHSRACSGTVCYSIHPIDALHVFLTYRYLLRYARTAHVKQKRTETIYLCVICALFGWQIYEGKSWGVNTDFAHSVLHATGASPRPYFVSTSNNITVLFRTGANIQAQYIGFRAFYYFVSSMSCDFMS